MGLDTSSLHLPSVSALAQDDAAVYAVLGTTLLTFVLTFGVVPQFKSHFKEPDSWREIYAEITAAGGVPSISPLEAVSEANRGCAFGRVQVSVRWTIAATLSTAQQRAM